MHDLRRQAAMHGRGGPEPHRRIDVVDAQLGRARGRIGNAGLHADPVAGLQVRDLGADLDHGSRCLVPQDHRLLDHEGADLAVGIVMHVRPADADRMDRDAHVGGRQVLIQRDVAQRQLTLVFQYQ